MEFFIQDVDLERGDSLFAKNVWVNVRNHPIIPLPMLRYPMPGARKNRTADPFGRVRQRVRSSISARIVLGHFSEPGPDRDATTIIQTRQGLDLDYRYILSRRQGETGWSTRLTTPRKIKCARRLPGAHVHQIHDDLLLQTKINYATDRTLLQNLSTSGIVRALPSQESVLNLTYRMTGGKAYLIGPIFTTLGRRWTTHVSTVTRNRASISSGDSGRETSLNSTWAWIRRLFILLVKKGSTSVDSISWPSLSVNSLHVGHVIGLRPQVKFREVLYSHGRKPSQSRARDRGTFWLGLEAVSNLSRRFQWEEGRLRHTIKPVCSTNTSDLQTIRSSSN